MNKYTNKTKILFVASHKSKKNLYFFYKNIASIDRSVRMHSTSKSERDVKAMGKKENVVGKGRKKLSVHNHCIVQTKYIE